MSDAKLRMPEGVRDARGRRAAGPHRALACALAAALALAPVPGAGLRALASELAAAQPADAAAPAVGDAGAVREDAREGAAGGEGAPEGTDVAERAEAGQQEGAATPPASPSPAAAGSGDAANASRTVAVAQAPAQTAPNLSETVVVSAPEPPAAEAGRDVLAPPALWAALYDTGELVLSASAEPDPAHGNALGIVDASATGTSFEERPAWLALAAERGVAVRRVTLAADARLAEGARCAAEALAEGEAPGAPAPTSLARWFFGLSELEGVEGLERLDTSLVTSAESAFEGCSSLVALDLRAWRGDSLGAAGAGTGDGAGGADAGVDDADAGTGDMTSSVSAADRAAATARLLAGCTVLAELGISESFGLLAAELPAASWEGGADAGRASSSLLCSAAAADVCGLWRRVGAGGTASAGDSPARGGASTGGGAWGGPVPVGADSSARAVATLVETAGGSVELLLFASQPGGGELSGATALGSWDVADTGAGRVPWEGRAADIEAVRVMDDVAPASMAGWFAGCAALRELDGAERIDTGGCRSLGAAFSGCSSLVTLDLSAWDTSAVRDLGSTFSGCSSLETLDLSGWDTGSALTMAGAFTGCPALSSVTLGEGFAFGAGCTLPEGSWERGAQGAGEALRLSAEELAGRAGAELAGTWTRLPQAARATARASAARVAALRVASTADNVSVTVPTAMDCSVDAGGAVSGSLSIQNTSAHALGCAAATELYVFGSSVSIAGGGATGSWEIAAGSTLELSLSGQLGAAVGYTPRSLGRISWSFTPVDAG